MSDNTEKKTRNITPKGFLNKCNTKAANSALGFIAQYRQYLTTGELSTSISPIIAKLDAGVLLPTPALNEIRNAVMTHIIAVDSKKVEDRKLQPVQESIHKPWIAVVLDENGVIQFRTKENGEMEDLNKSFALASEADRWMDLRLFEGAYNWHGEITNSDISCIHEIINRRDAIARILAKKKSPVSHQKAKTTNRLGFGMKAKQDRSTFSRG